MKLPKTLQICGHRWQIKHEKLEEDWGQCDGDKRQITIHSEISKSEALQTLRHEIIHAVFYETGWNQLLGPMEEGITRLIENQLFPVLGDLSNKTESSL